MGTGGPAYHLLLSTLKGVPHPSWFCLGGRSSRTFTCNGIPIRSRLRPVHSPSISTILLAPQIVTITPEAYTCSHRGALWSDDKIPTQANRLGRGTQLYFFSMRRAVSTTPSRSSCSLMGKIRTFQFQCGLSVGR